MTGNGTQKSKEERMNPSVKISLNIVPFGSINLQISGAERPVVENRTEKPRYVEPAATNIEKVDIHFHDDSKTYLTPITTAG